jgi:Fe-S cluster assembly protein SufD
MTDANIKEKISLKHKIADEFERFSAGADKSSNLFSIRKKAFDSFVEQGFPTLKNEEWKYTNVNFLNRIDFDLSVNSSESDIPDSSIENHLLKGVDENLLVFINGKFSEKHSKLVSKGEKIQVGCLSSALEAEDPALIEHFNKYLNYDNNPFAALNTAFAQDGAFIHLKQGVRLEEPLHILFITDARLKPVISFFRNLYIMDKSSRARIIESSYTIGDNEGLAIVESEAYIDNYAALDHLKLQDDNQNGYYIGTLQACQEQNSIFNNNTITLSGAFVRNDLNSTLNGEFCETNYLGMYFMNDNNFVDNHTLADHCKPNCNSNELYKGILDGKSTGVFNGKIIVRPDAQKTNAYQQNRNILLTADAKINAKPQLEIYADDVKCSHGATTGKLDEDMLFYLRARGIGEDYAKSLLLHAFLSEVSDKIEIENLREIVADKVVKRLKLPYAGD